MPPREPGQHVILQLQHIEFLFFIKHLLLLCLAFSSGWVTVPYYYLSHHQALCVPVCDCVLEVCVCFLLWRGGAGWTNMSFSVSGCRANIDQRAQRHAAGQIKHSSDGLQGTKSQWHALSPGWISLRLSDWLPAHHTVREGERHRDEHELHIHIYIWICSLCCWKDIHFPFSVFILFNHLRYR